MTERPIKTWWGQLFEFAEISGYSLTTRDEATKATRRINIYFA